MRSPACGRLIDRDTATQPHNPGVCAIGPMTAVILIPKIAAESNAGFVLYVSGGIITAGYRVVRGYCGAREIRGSCSCGRVADALRIL